MAREQWSAAQERVSEAYRVYYPSVAAQSFVGKERRINPDADDTLLNGREVSLSLTQRVYDFGASDSTVGVAKLNEKRAKLVTANTEQQVLFEGLAAIVNLSRSIQVRDFAKSSVANILRQTELEDERVRKGAGLTTDVLQAKTQLIGAEARLVLAEADMERAVNRYRTVFGFPPESTTGIVEVTMDPKVLPMTLDEALSVARGENTALEVASLDREISKEVQIGTESSLYYPSLDIVGEQIWRKDVEGIAGYRGESIIRLQLSYEFDLGLTLRNTIRAASADFRATQSAYGDALDLTDEQVRNAWSDLQTTTRNSVLLEEQATVAQEFLTLARQERKSGQRSLIDVLAGETALINAQSDAVSARANVVIAELNLLLSMGVLNIDALHP